MYARKGEYHHIPTETKAADDDAQVDCKLKVGGFAVAVVQVLFKVL